MTVDIRARPISVTITVLDSTATTISGPHDVSDSLADGGLSISHSEIDMASPNGLASFRGQLNLLADVRNLSLSLDDRSTAGTPSGASLLAQGNRVDIQVARADGVTMGSVCPPLYILKVEQPLNLPRRILRLSLGDATLLEGRTPEGERAGFSRGTTTNRSAVINSYLTASDIPATADSLTRYPLAAPPQKTSSNNWAQEAGAISGAAGAYLWIDGNGDTRITDIDFEQSAPVLSLTIGANGDDAGTDGWRRETNDTRPPRQLTCYATGSVPVEIENPRNINRTVPGDGFTALTETGTESWSFGTSPTYELDVTERQAERLILPEIRTLSSGIVTGLAPNTSTALRDSKSIRRTIEYSGIYGHELQETIIERVPRAQAGGNAYVPTLGDTTSDALNLVTTTTTITSEYNGITQRLERRVTSITKPWCLFEWTGDRPVNYDANRLLERESYRNTETWQKAQGSTFGGNSDQPQLWRYESTVLRARGVIEEDYTGINADVLVTDHRESFDKTGSGPEFEPPDPRYQQERYSLRREQYEGTASFTPIAGDAYKNKEDSISLRGGDIVSNDQCSFLTQLIGLFRHGRSLGASFVGVIPEWLFTGYRPGARIDVAINGQVIAFMLDGWVMNLEETSAAWGATLLHMGVVGATPDIVTPPVTVTIAPTAFPALIGRIPSAVADAGLIEAFPALVGNVPAMAVDATITEDTGASATAWTDINTSADWLGIDTNANWIDLED